MAPFSALALFTLVSVTAAWPVHYQPEKRVTEWLAPGPNDHRGPCPAINLVANHGFLPRNGQNITMDALVDALSDGLNVDKFMGTTQATSAFHLLATVDPVSGQKVLDLADLSKHGALEHDASLTRDDVALGDNARVNVTLVHQLLSTSSDGETLSLDDIAAYRRKRDVESAAADPTFSMGAMATFQKYHESSQLMTVLKNTSDPNGGVPLEWAREWFVYERMPTQYGWTRPLVAFGWTETLKVAAEISMKVEKLKLGL